MKKDMYVSPQVEVIEMENEGVIAVSGGLSDVGDDGGLTRSARSGFSNPVNNTAPSDLEDMINDILTIEQ